MAGEEQVKHKSSTSLGRGSQTASLAVLLYPYLSALPLSLSARLPPWSLCPRSALRASLSANRRTASAPKPSTRTRPSARAAPPLLPSSSSARTRSPRRSTAAASSPASVCRVLRCTTPVSDWRAARSPGTPSLSSSCMLMSSRRRCGRARLSRRWDRSHVCIFHPLEVVRGGGGRLYGTDEEGRARLA